MRIHLAVFNLSSGRVAVLEHRESGYNNHDHQLKLQISGTGDELTYDEYSELMENPQHSKNFMAVLEGTTYKHQIITEA